jgi:predicted small secreted protein
MSVITIRKSVLWGVVVLFLAVPMALTSCNSPMGMGDPIDWEPPVLTLDPGPNPRYVRLGTVITGTVTDNIGVERVIVRDAVSGKQLFTATLLPKNRWEVALNFTDKDNGEKLTLDFVAFDKIGNAAVVNLTVIVDLSPPVVLSAEIERSPGKIAYLEKWSDLSDLETTDPRGERNGNMHRYQNGWFTFKAKLNEDETRIEKVVLKVYDSGNYTTPIYSKEMDPALGSLYSPQWIIKEEELLDKGNEIIGPNYKSDYYNNGKRYYYQVFISSFDKSENEGTLAERVEDQLFFCMWEQADVPKGILDPIIGNTVYKQMLLPIQLFDDDSLEKAYAGLVTVDQWNSYVSPTATNDQKLAYLKEALFTGSPVIQNWKADDRYIGEHLLDDKTIKEYIDGKNVDDILIHLDTGNQPNDYGNFVLFTIVQDKKLAPHPATTATGAADTLKPRWKGRYFFIDIIDDNMPLIVFDTTEPTLPEGNDLRTGNSPEENTFPKLTDGKFEINGYTLRENSSGENEVRIFRMAWIPHAVLAAGDEKAIIKQVENALRWYGDPYEGGKYPFPPGVDQYWNLDLITDEEDPVYKGEEIRKQVFRKQFDILGGADDLKPAYNNFTYDGKLENETKVFVFCAVDNMQKSVFRTLRLLANKTPPDLTVYDITDITVPSLPAGIPNVYASSSTGDITPEYIALRQTYNNDAYTALKGVSSNLADDKKTVPFQTYPRGASVKYWITAEKEGSLRIKEITMEDVTVSREEGQPAVFLGSEFGYVPADRTVSYIEYFPEVTQRVFSFTATDVLGNVATLQRTIAITSAAMLTSITTTEQNGTYGIGRIIKLRANFDRQIQTQGNIGNILLNVRYENPAGTYRYYQIPCARGGYPEHPLYLEFDFEVKEGDGGRLITLYDDSTEFSGAAANRRRPISFGTGAGILDMSRQDSAFTPGNTTGFVWTSAANSLQDPINGKNIALDGVRPNITGVRVAGKSFVNVSGTNTYYFKGGEEITFTLTADKDIRPEGATTPRLQYQIRAQDGTVYPTTGYYNAFAYLKPGATLPGDTTPMVFSLTVNRTGLPNDGQLINFSLSGTGGTITDDVGNSVTPATVTAARFTTMLGNIAIYNDQTLPPAPRTTLTAGGQNYILGAATEKLYLNAGATLTIDVAPTASEPFGTTRRQYSLNGGLEWTEYGGNVSISNGDYNIMTRYIDAAGNEGPPTSRLVQINAAFPRLSSVNTEEPTGTYTSGTLTFNLNFSDQVTVNNAENATITLTNRNATNTHNTGGTRTDSGGNVVTTGNDYSYQRTLRATAGQTNTSIKFEWVIAAATPTKEMLDGLYISSVNLTGLQDRFGNIGPTNGTASFTGGNAGNISINDCPNLIAGTIVDTIPPRIGTWNPALNTDLSADDRRIIRITFNEPVMAGSGTITVRPRTGNWLIPPVFENDGYYLGTNGQRYATLQNVPNGVYATYIDGFYDIYNNGNLNAADRRLLTKSTGDSWGTLELNPRTGQTVGPYMRLTHGLKIGSGYNGNYTGTYNGTGPNPETGGTGDNRYLIPDTATKWVLDYKLRINDTNNSDIAGICNTLTKAKFRWQEIDVINTTVDVPTRRTVTVTLNEPLLAGLEWEIYFPEGTFTDTAGNKAPAVAENTQTFWTSGAQTPVIRVNRRSYDARAVGTGPTDLSPSSTREGTTAHNPPADTNWTATTTVTDLNGWGINDFNTVHYRIETETPGAALYSRVYSDTTAARRTNRNSVTAAYGGNVYDANPTAALQVVNSAWNLTDRTNGTWILTNLIRRAGTTNNTISYQVTENGNAVTRTSQGNYYGFRSYNKDATLDNLTNATTFTLSALGSTTDYQGVVTFGQLEAGKSYVVAQATRNGQQSARGYEGVFRTVIALYNTDSTATASTTRPTMVEGSNIKNGMPSVAGFPVRDAEETGDNRYVKMFLRLAGNTSNAQLLWVSTEIVCEWYFIKFGGNNGNATHMSAGEVNNYLMVGYGDLTYGHNIRSSSDQN